MSELKNSVYFDHAATTPIHPDVLRVVLDAMKTEFGNPSSLHLYGRKAFASLEEARNHFASELGALSGEIVFTSGGTESDNTAITQIAKAREMKGKHVITTNVEHSAVLEPMKQLEKDGFDVTYLPVDETGVISFEDFKKALTPSTILVSIMYVNNETGSIMPIQKIGKYLHEYHPDILFHTDAVQAFGLQDIDVNEAKIDLLSASAHKLNGPKGVGVLFVREGIFFSNFMKGGAQELNKRAGTVNVPGILGFQKASEIMESEREHKKEEYHHFRQHIIKGLTKKNIAFVVNGHEHEYSPHILNLWIKNIPSAKLLIQLDLADFSVAAGSACSAGNTEPSHVLTAMYGSEHPAVTESIRISFGLGNSMEDVERFVAVLSKIAGKYQ